MNKHSFISVTIIILIILGLTGCQLFKESEGDSELKELEESALKESEELTVQELRDRQADEFQKIIMEKYDQSFPGVPGVCSTIEECRQICPTTNLCVNFCMQNPQNELCLLKHEQTTSIPGKCSNYEGCGIYCKEHPDEPDCGFAKIYEPEIPIFSMPFDMKYFRSDRWGLWPFCVHGGDHPEGHGGIDFELDANTPILASADGVVEEVFAPEDDPLAHGGYSVFLSHERVATGYVCLFNVNLKKGDAVKKGDFLGNPCKLPEGEYFIHYEVNNFADHKLECPSNYLDDDFKKNLETMLSKASYPEKSVEPDICNCEWLPYKATMKTE